MFHFKVAHGKHYDKPLGGGGVKRYNKGDKIKSLRDLRKLFPNKFDLISEEEVKAPSAAPSLKLVSDKGRYNVVNTATGKPINEEPLTKSEAESLLKSEREDA